jgi:hypothetical protein
MLRHFIANLTFWLAPANGMISLESAQPGLGCRHIIRSAGRDRPAAGRPPCRNGNPDRSPRPAGAVRAQRVRVGPAAGPTGRLSATVTNVAA